MTDETIKYPSVTGLTGLLPKNLTWWASGAAAACALDERADWAHLPTRDEQFDYIKRAHDRVKNTAGDLGTEVKKFVEAQNRGKPVPTGPLPVKARMLHFARFVEDFAPRVESAEVKVYHDDWRDGLRQGGGHPNRYAGTLDMIAEIDGHLSIIDIKTGKNVWPEACLQINAYAYADFLIADPFHPGAKQITPKRGKRWYEWHGPAEDEIPMPEITKGYVLHLRDDGYDLHEVPIGDEFYDMFLALFSVDRWERTLKKAALTGIVQPPFNEKRAEQAIAEFGGAA